jgi:hypothetical protein
MERTNRNTHSGRQEAVTLPAAPRTTSPHPELTSVHTTPGRGPYGDPGYRGNCSGLLIRDLLLFYRPRRVLDPMEGGGTCGDVCRSLAIPYEGRDLKGGFDATRWESYRGLGYFDFVWMHPPYWQMVRYNPNHPACLSNAPNVQAFTDGLRAVFENCRRVLSPGGKIAVLMGDGKQDGRYLALPFRTMSAASAAGLWLAAPEIIRFSHGTTSARKTYSGSFIPRVHDTCLVLGVKRPGGKQSGPHRS